jgi:tetratricopeptide (TPR) repeat protein
MSTTPLFRTLAAAESKPESPVLMFRDLKRDPNIKFLWGHQEKTLDSYFQSYRDATDIAIELPTGTGKTLVGLLIGEYRRRAFDERVAFLCSTRQLCAQVSRLAEKYGIPTALFVGPQADYDAQKFAQYQQGKSIAVTTYSGIFNSNPKISDPHVLICDDAHSADGFVSSMWTIRITRYDDEQAFLSIVKFLQAGLPENLVHRMLHFESSPLTRTSVDLISVISLYDRLKDLRKLMEELVEDTEFVFAWRAISQHLPACSLYCSPDTIELRPILSPTRTHPPFSDARQRVYMSATLSEDGDIERSFGVKEIKKLPVPEGWDRRGTGRRLMLFPGLTDLQTQAEALPKLIGIAGKSLILVPDIRTRDKFKESLKAQFTVLTSADTEQEIEKFRKAATPVILILANRYDGIDFPGDDCRSLVVFGLPTGSSLQEAYLVYRLNAVSQLRDRIRTRVTQAVGRCTRDENDFSVVIIDGKDLLKWFCTRENTVGMHPELQAEIAFGLENSENRNSSELIALAEALLNKTSDWDAAEADLKSRRNAATKKKDPCADALAKAAPFEIDYLYNLWEGNYDQAYKHADHVLQLVVGENEARPYRAFWEHQAAVAAFLTWKQRGDEQFKQTALRRLENATKNRVAVNWIGDLISRISGSSTRMEDNLPIQEWFNVLDTLLEELGIQGGKFQRRISELQRFIAATSPNQFHQALEWLGKLLGANSKQWKSSGAPDGCWQFGTWFATVFEAKTEEFSAGSISLKTVRQAGTHERTAKEDKTLPESTPTATIIISPRDTLAKDAAPHAKEIYHLSHDAIVQLFNRAAIAFEELRLAAPDSGSHELREKAIDIYKKHGVYMSDIRQLLTSSRLDSLPVAK